MKQFPGADVLLPVFVEAQAKVQDAAAGDWLTWQAQVSPITVIAIIGAFVGFGGWIFKLGTKNSEIEAGKKAAGKLDDRVVDLEKGRSADREAVRKEVEAFMVAVNAGLAASEARAAEFRELAQGTFATKSEMKSLEERTNRGMDRIADRLEQISTRLEKIGDGILQALASKG